MFTKTKIQTLALIERKHLTRVFLLLTAVMGNAYADGLNDLNAALERLQGTEAISAELESSFTEIRDAGEDVKKGLATVWLDDNAKGLKVTYSKEVIKNIELEAQLRIENEDADTPTLNAVNDLRAATIREMLSANKAIARRVSQATFIDEQQVDFQGQVVRQLNFELPLKAVIKDKKVREYVKKFSAKYQILIDDEGIPFQTTLDYQGKGRAYIVLSMKAKGSRVSKYTVVSDRLVRLSSHHVGSYSSTFGDTETTEEDKIELKTSLAANNDNLTAN